MKNKYLLFYYVILIVILCSWTSTTSSPNLSLRLVYLFALTVPAVLSENWVPLVFTCFMTVATQGFAYSYFPSGVEYYGYCALFSIILLAVFNKKGNFRSIPPIIYITVIYVSLIDLLTSLEIQPFTYMGLMLVCIIASIGFDGENYRLKWATAFSIATIVLSAAFLLNRDVFTTMYDAGLERTGWTDANYFGMVLGMGSIISVNELFVNEQNISKYVKVIFYSCIAISLPVLFMNASRGAILSVSVGMLVTFIGAKIKPIQKYLIIAAFVAFIGLLYTNEYLELFIYRVNNLQGGDATNGRVDIWIHKLNAFFNEGSIFEILFGYGFENAINVGVNKGFHNDFVAFIVEYGFIGIILFLTMLLNPYRIFVANGKKNIYFLSLFGYLIFCLFSLEPFTNGTIPFVFFYAYMFYLSVKNPCKSLNSPIEYA